jgi:hypothetical protein
MSCLGVAVSLVSVALHKFWVSTPVRARSLPTKFFPKVSIILHRRYKISDTESVVK